MAMDYRDSSSSDQSSRVVYRTRRGFPLGGILFGLLLGIILTSGYFILFGDPWHTVSWHNHQVIVQQYLEPKSGYTELIPSKKTESSVFVPDGYYLIYIAQQGDSVSFNGLVLPTKDDFTAASAKKATFIMGYASHISGIVDYSMKKPGSYLVLTNNLADAANFMAQNYPQESTILIFDTEEAMNHALQPKKATVIFAPPSKN